MSYDRLEAAAVLETAQRLRDRIVARFPDRNLGKVADQLVGIASELEQVAARTRLIRVVRVATLVLIVALVLIAVASVVAVVTELVRTSTGAVGLMSTLSNVISNLVYAGLAVIFLWVLPGQLERRRLLAELHRLRSLAHVIDMHQLAKDPERFSGDFRPTDKTVDTGLSPIEMAGYLDYCSELLSLVAKTGAVYAERSTDPAVLSTISDVENLTSGMARKIWQKLSLLPGVAPGTAAAQD